MIKILLLLLLIVISSAGLGAIATLWWLRRVK